MLKKNEVFGLNTSLYGKSRLITVSTKLGEKNEGNNSDSMVVSYVDYSIHQLFQ